MVLWEPYLSNVDESTHKVLIAERTDGLLGLIPRGVFHNPTQGQRKSHAGPASRHTRIPT